MKKKQTNTFLLYFILFVIAIFLVFFVSFKFFSVEEEYETLDYNFFEFVKIDNTWYTEWQQDETVYTVSMRNHPSEVADVPVEGSLDDTFDINDVYITFHPEKGNLTILNLGITEFTLSLFKVFKIHPKPACMINNSELCPEVPIITCENNASVIQIVHEGNPGIFLEGNCVQLQGSGWDIIKSIDRFLYQLYGIMK